MLEAERTKVELTAFASTKEDAHRAYAEGNYDEAARLLFSALKDAIHLYGKESLEESECLRALADCYYKSDRFIEAKSVYKQILDPVSGLEELDDTDEGISSRFKLAKSHQKLQEFDDSLVQFKRVLSSAEKLYTLGTPTLTTILEAFADMLRRSRKEPKLLAELEEKARISRMKFADPENANANLSENIINDMEIKKAEAEAMRPVWAPKNKQVAQLFYKTSEQTEKILAFKKEHPRRFGLLVLSPIMVALMSLCGAVSIAYCEARGIITPPPGSLAAAGKEYYCAQTQQTISFLPNNSAVIGRQNGTKTVPYTYARRGWSEILTLAFFRKADELRLAIQGDGAFEDRTEHYTQGKLVRGIHERLYIIGTAIQRLRRDRKPVTPDSLAKICPASLSVLPNGLKIPAQIVGESWIQTSHPDSSFSEKPYPANCVLLANITEPRTVTVSRSAPGDASYFDKDGHQKIGGQTESFNPNLSSTVQEITIDIPCVIAAICDDQKNVYYDKNPIIVKVTPEDVKLNSEINPVISAKWPSQIVIGFHSVEFINDLMLKTANLFLWLCLQTALAFFISDYHVMILSTSGNRHFGLLQTYVAYMLWFASFGAMLLYFWQVFYLYIWG